MTETYQKHKYEINIVECAQNVIRKLSASKVTINMKISIDEYAKRLKMAVKSYNWSIGLSKDASTTQKMNAQVISTNHPAFDFWLALHLTIMEPHEIPLLLDAYQRNEFEPLDNFIGHIEFFALTIIHFNVFYPCDEHKKEIVQWVREIRKIHTQQVNQLNIGELHINLVTNIERINVLFDQRSIINNFNATNIFYADDSQQPIKQEDATENPSTNSKALIKTGREKDTVLGYFNQLTEVLDKDKKPYLTKDEISNFVFSNFYFKDIEPKSSNCQLDIKIDKQHLNQLFYDFYNEFDSHHYKNKIDLYIDLLMNTFKQFANQNKKVMKTNFAKRSKGGYPFRIKK